jgi:adenine deaminase
MIDTLHAEGMKDLAEVALGNRKAHLVVKGAALLNVYTREGLRDYSVEPAVFLGRCRESLF